MWAINFGRDFDLVAKENRGAARRDIGDRDHGGFGKIRRRKHHSVDRLQRVLGRQHEVHDHRRGHANQPETKPNDFAAVDA